MSQVGLDRLPGDFGDRDSAAIGLVAQSGIEIVRQLYRSPFHGMPAYREPEIGVNKRDTTLSRRVDGGAQRRNRPTTRFDGSVSY